MKTVTYATQLNFAWNQEEGERLAQHLSLSGPHARQLYENLSLPDRMSGSDFGEYTAVYNQKLPAPLNQLAALHTQAFIALNDRRDEPRSGIPRPQGDTVRAAAKQHELVTVFLRYLVTSEEPTGWALPLLFTVTRELKWVSELADAHARRAGFKPVNLEEASRLLQKCFSACLNDRTGSKTESRKMGIYYIACLLIKCYFKLSSTTLCKNVMNGIKAADLLPLSSYPLAHQLTYTYYLGVFAFLREDYPEAERILMSALQLCHAKQRRNVELILDYLVPVLLLRGVLPSEKLFQSQRRIRELYQPFVQAFKAGNIAMYDEQLRAGEKRLMQRGTYLVVERAREGVLRGLFKKAWLLENKSSRMSVATYQDYMKRAGESDIDLDEVECLLANMIFKKLMKGYISHAHRLVVLAKEQPYPPYEKLSPAIDSA